MEPELTVAELQRQVRQLEDAKGFQTTLEQRLAYLMSEVGEVAKEVLRLSRDGSEDVGKMEAAETKAVVENLGMQIYDVIWNLLDLADMVGIDLEEAFKRKASLNEGRRW